MKIATKLTKRVADFVNPYAGGIYSEGDNTYFVYPNFFTNEGFKCGYHGREIHQLGGYTFVSEQKFIDMVTDELSGKTDQLENRQFESGSIRDNDNNKPLVNHLDAYVRLRFGYHLRKGATKYGKGNWQKGQPDEAALESLNRHLALHELGDRSEDHLSAIIFNVQLIMMNEKSNGIEVNHYFNK